MKTVRSHDYRIDGYGNVNFIKVDIGSGHSTYKVEAEKEQKTEPGIAWLKEGLKPSQSSLSFSAKMLAPWKTGTMSITTTTRGWSRRKGSTHEIHPLSTHRAAHTALHSPRGRR